MPVLPCRTWAFRFLWHKVLVSFPFQRVLMGITLKVSWQLPTPPLLLPPSPTSGQPEAAGRVFSHVLFQSDVSLLLMLSLFLTSTFLSFVALPFLSLFPGFVWWHPSLMSSRALLLLVIYTLQEAQANCENKAVHGAVTGTSVHCSNVASFHLSPKQLFGSTSIWGRRMASPQRKEHWNL